MVPAPLSHTSASVLEFDSLRDVLQGYAASPLGRARIAALVPSGDQPWIERQHRLVTEVREFLRTGSRFDFAGLADPEPHLARAGVEGVALETAAIQEVLNLLERAAQWRELCLHPPSALAAPLKELNELSRAISDFSELLRFFHGKILPNGTLDDRASPELARLRREVEKHKRHIQQSLGAY
ncbi:MAG: endonuclease MutS2, partial [Terriglobales bacterium]